MKKILIVVLCLILAIGAVGCSGSGLSKYEADQINKQIDEANAAVQASASAAKERNAPLVGEWKYTDEHIEIMKSLDQYVSDTPLDFSDDGFVAVDTSARADEDNVQIAQYYFDTETNTVTISDYMDTNVGEITLTLKDGSLYYDGDVMYVKK